MDAHRTITIVVGLSLLLEGAGGAAAVKVAGQSTSQVTHMMNAVTGASTPVQPLGTSKPTSTLPSS